uniref:Chitinase-like protein Idgf4 n=1 Tax=Cacopsylla melanoneura TaxID=428564 RepID=A0A8D8VEV2_9HEMI
MAMFSPAGVLVVLMMAVVNNNIAASEVTLGQSPPNVICFYVNLAATSKDPLKNGPEELVPALDKCTHLVYQDTQISKAFEIQSLRPDIDTEIGMNLFRKITDLKKQFPKLKILISISSAENFEGQQRYIEVLHEESHQGKLVDSVEKFLKEYNFDGVNLAWLFPPNAHKVDKIQSDATPPPTVVDPNPEKSRLGFGKLVELMSKRLRPAKLLTTVMVIPHVDYHVYYDIPTLNRSSDLIILEAHDLPSPSSKYDVVDQSGPIYFAAGKQDEFPNIDKKLKYFLEKGAVANKIVITADSYGSWALIKKSDLENPTNQTEQSPGGIVFYFEVCEQIKTLPNPSEHSAAFLNKLNYILGDEYFKEAPGSANPNPGVPIQLKDEYAVWLAYEDAKAVAFKTSYAKQAGLAGVALNVLSFDDTRGSCSGVKYPLLSTIATSWK